VEHNDVGIQVEVDQPGPATGAIPAAIKTAISTAKITAVVEPKVKEVQQLIGDNYLIENLAKHIEAELQPIMAGNVESGINKPEIGKNGTVFHLSAGVSLLLSVEFSFCSDLRALQTTLTAHIVDRKNHNTVYSLTPRSDDDKTRILYRNKLTYLSTQLPDQDMDNLLQLEKETTSARERKYIRRAIDRSDRPVQRMEAATERLKLWEADDGVLLKKEIDTGLTGVLQLLLDDISTEQQANTASQQRKTIFHRDDERMVFRLNHARFPGAVTSEPIAFMHAPSNDVVHCCAAQEAEQEERRHPGRRR
jgi:hypothetical protein